MKLGRRTTICLIGAVVAFNMLLRYPRSEHELGVDSIFVHVLSAAIVGDGYAEWVLNPLSYFGWYPLSYPSAGPFLLASTTFASDLNLEASILLVSFLLGPIGILGAFLMAREVRNDNLFAVTVALLFGLAPRFLIFTMWSASTRNLFMALLPIFIWAILASYRRPSRVTYGLLAVSLILLTATHRLAILLAVVLIAFVVASIFVVGMRLLRKLFPRALLRDSVRRSSPYLALAAIALIVAAMIVSTDVLQEYSQGELASGSEPSIQIANLSVSLARSAGFALVLVPLGLIVLARQKNKRISEPFLAATFIGLVPTLLLRTYTGFYILPFLAIFGGLGFIGIFAILRRYPRILKVVGVVTLAIIIGFSGYVLEVEIDRSTQIPGTTYGTGIYVRQHSMDGTFVTNEGFMGIRVAAISGGKVLPIGGAGTTFQSPELLVHHFFTVEEVNSRIVRISIQEVTIESDSLWVATGIQAELDWVEILNSPYGQVPTDLQARYQPAYYLEIKAQAGKYLAYGNIYCSNLGNSVQSNAYLLYDNGLEILWWLQAPNSASEPGTPTRMCG